MAKGSSRPAKVTAENLEEAARLQILWDAKADRPSQMKFGETYDIGTQGAVWRFLNGKDPLSLKAALGFARGLGCKISDFSPRLAAHAAALSESVRGDALPSTEKKGAVFEAVTASELEFLRHYRQLLGSDRKKLLSEVEKLAAERKAQREEMFADAGINEIMERAANAVRGGRSYSHVDPDDQKLKQRQLPGLE